MNSKQTFLVFILFLLSITSISAQYGNNGYGGNGYGRNGYNNSMSQMNQSQPEKPKEIPTEVTVQKVMDIMKPAINLDALQVIAISNVISESMREQSILLKQNYNQEDQEKNFKALSETTDRNINQFLNPDQKEKYLAFKEDMKNPKKLKEKRSKSKEKKD
ncbi:hypothetical protein [Flavobacterium cellulosilyticum]|uniref:DUF4168 domain-containing protein n=1 Tax=Flavobacterium cellulosilyticum TaxID=2541731 RepID=A0A4R5CBU6_9FLAO|nr:hypothetical protein [Flavobacterium cellulosilyticum]TDD97431.1 hypothetical protein E0F76_08980 [Flavobacterium cellulosilyticum]